MKFNFIRLAIIGFDFVSIIFSLVLVMLGLGCQKYICAALGLGFRISVFAVDNDGFRPKPKPKHSHSRISSFYAISIHHFVYH